MKIPQNITKEHLIKAANKILKEGIPIDGKSKMYDVLYESQYLPPKLIVSYANLFANNTVLERTSFKGGIGTECFKLLEENGFKIMPKNAQVNTLESSYYPELQKFLLQAEGDSLKTKNYIKSYEGLKVKVSFGQGVKARIPWISFLGQDQTTSKGIYPVYLHMERVNTLILAYGVSETERPEIDWPVNGQSTLLRDYFSKKNLPIPERYHTSYIFKAYDLGKDLNPVEMENDLINLINYYKKVLAREVDGNFHNNKQEINFSDKSFKNTSEVAGLIFSDKLVSRYVSSLCTKPFVLLSGLSGSGKTKLAQSFAQWISEDESQYCIVPVGADWTNREPLLGYPNALDSTSYVQPENGVLNLLIKANVNPTKPYFLILDEMNLSHVERYFADFLSAMESGKDISLHSDKEGKKDSEEKEIPNKVGLPKNLFIVGTVNIDETTYMFSPKVLDRANVIEFRISEDEIENYLKNPGRVDLGKLNGRGAGMAESFVELAKSEVELGENADLTEELLNFFKELKKLGAEFGYRSASEIVRLVGKLGAVDTDNSLSPNDKIDIAVMQKLLPKIHGSQRKLDEVLKTLATFCVNDEEDAMKFFEKGADISINGEAKYPLSLEKICRMHKSATENGFASYAEA